MTGNPHSSFAACSNSSAITQDQSRWAAPVLSFRVRTGAAHLGPITDNGILKELFLQRLPANVRMVLASADYRDLAKLADMADKIVEVATPQTRYTYYLFDDGRLEIRDTYAHRKVSDVARLWGSHCMRERE